jgi:hypothetical protein
MVVGVLWRRGGKGAEEDQEIKSNLGAHGE